jgi:tetratricopeptide (TPR) repeat protein
MALVVSAYDLVVRVDALAKGIAAFAQRAPNNTFCSDGALARVSFMRDDDREQFASRLVDVPAAAIARIDRRDSRCDAAWLERGKYAGVEAVWLRNAPREPLVVPLHWKPGELAFATWDEMKEHLEYLGVEGNVEVYLDKRTGKRLYAGRTEPVIDRERAREIEKLRTEANELVGPFLLRRDKLGFFESRRVKKGIVLLEKIVGITPDDWSTRWMLGMCTRVVGEQVRALEHFRRAYAANPRHPDVGREYAGQCFILGEAAEGLQISRDLHARFPDDVGLHSNLALALLIGGDLDEALAVAEAAHRRDPADPITKSLLGYIIEVKAGRQPRPTRLP